MRILFIKPYQPIDLWIAAPPLGLLTLAAVLRERFPDADVQVVDMNVRGLSTDWMQYAIAEFRPDVVGFSALNFQLAAAVELAATVKKISPITLTVLGGPVTHRRSAEILRSTPFDWVFEGEAERSFPTALSAYFAGDSLIDIPGLSLRAGDTITVCKSTDRLPDLNALPFPAWDLCDFDLYARQPNGNLLKRHHRYAYLFTSRGCPYKCNYCHDVFGKKFYATDAGRVISEIDFLYERYGIREFHIVDDIFNFDPERLTEILNQVRAKYGKKLTFCFPNGLRADILTPELIDLMADTGTLSIAVAIETASKRLQRAIKKHLQIEKALAIVNRASARGIIVKGFFMLGFPTETKAEMAATVNLALHSRISIGHFFTVTPQPGSPLYEAAVAEKPATMHDLDPLQQYNAEKPWYEIAYGFPLRKFVRRAYLRFYFNPLRIFRLLFSVPWRSYTHALPVALSLFFRKRPILPKPQPYFFQKQQNVASETQAAALTSHLSRQNSLYTAEYDAANDTRRVKSAEGA